MVTVRDVTELKKLQVASAQKALELSMIEQLMQIEAPKFHEVYDQSMSLLNECKKLCAKPDSNDDDITIIFRDLHTAKGVLRTYGLKITSALIHDTEEAFIEVKNSGAKHIPDDQQAEMLHKIGESIASLESYKIVNDEKLGRSQNNSNLDKKSLSEVKRVINLFFSDAVEAEKLFGKVESILNKTYKNSIKEHIRDLVDRVSTSAQSLGKEALRFAYEGENITLKTEDWNILDGIFTHMIRNSLDHGVELPEERQQANKESSGLISMEAATDSQWLHIKFYDDGRGLNLNKLRSKGGLDENASDAEVANLIFKPSMSTADNVTDIYGRGVGMDAVKASIQEFGGSIDLELGQRQGDFIPAKISLKLPLSRLELEKIDQKAS